MPTVHIEKDVFARYLGKTLTFVELNDLSFEFGIEVEEKEIEEEEKKEDPKDKKKKKKQEKRFEYVFEIAANRPDLLSVEGLTIALGCYLKLRDIPKYELT